MRFFILLFIVVLLVNTIPSYAVELYPSDGPHIRPFCEIQEEALKHKKANMLSTRHSFKMFPAYADSIRGITYSVVSASSCAYLDGAIKMCKLAKKDVIELGQDIQIFNGFNAISGRGRMMLFGDANFIPKTLGKLPTGTKVSISQIFTQRNVYFSNVWFKVSTVKSDELTLPSHGWIEAYFEEGDNYCNRPGMRCPPD